MGRKRVGDSLVEGNVISEEQLAAALKEQKKTHRRLGKVLIELGFIDEDKLAEVLARQVGADLVDLTEISITPEIAKLLPKDFCLENKVIPLAKDGNRIVIAMADPFDVVTLDMVTLFTGAEVKVAVAREREISDAIEKFCFEDEIELVPSSGDDTKENKDILLRKVVEEGDDFSKLDPKKIFIPRKTLQMISWEFCVNNKVIPLCIESGNYLLVGVADPDDVVTLDMLKTMTGKEIKPVIFSQKDILHLLNHFYHDDPGLEESTQTVSDRIVSDTAPEVLEALDELAKDLTGALQRVRDLQKSLKK